MNPNEPTRAQVLKEAPKPAKFPCGFIVAAALLVLTALLAGVIR